MVARLPENVLNKHAHNILTSAKPSAFSWFQQIRDLCIQYMLPHPLSILQNPVRKQTYNKLVKSKVTDYWEQKLRYQATSLTSAPYFKPGYMSLSKPHPMLFACGSNPFECNKAVITARMLSGRYPTDKLQRHWSQNQSGFCLLPECAQSESLGTLEHLLLYCTALKNTRRNLFKLAYEVASESPHLYRTLLNTLLSGKETEIMQMLLDCTTMPSIISLTQLVGPATRDRLLYFGRTWCYTVHRERMKLIGLFCYR